MVVNRVGELIAVVVLVVVIVLNDVVAVSNDVGESESW